MAKATLNERKHLIGVALQLQRVSCYHHGRKHGSRHVVEEAVENYILTCRQRETLSLV